MKLTNAQTREKVLKKILSEYKQIKCKNLLEKLNNITDSEPISERTLKADIKKLKENGFEINSIKLGKEHFYTLGGIKSSVEKSDYDDDDEIEKELSEQDKILLFQIKKIIEQFDYIPQNETFKRFYNKISSFDYLNNKNYLKWTLPIIFENSSLNNDNFVIINFTPIYNAIINKKQLKIDFKDFKNNDESEYIISPIQLRQYKHRWYVFGINHSIDNKIFNLPLERILAVEELDIAADYQNKIEILNHRLNQIIGVTYFEEEELLNIVLKIKNPRAKFIETRALHSSQKITEKNNEYCLFEYKLRRNWELENEIMSLGTDVEVISPIYLRDIIKNKLSNALAQYKK